MKKVLSLNFSSYFYIFSLGLSALLSSCEFQNPLSFSEDKKTNPPVDSKLDPSRLLLKNSQPMVWGGTYWDISDDNILPGTLDTTASCRAYLDTVSTTPIYPQPPSPDSLILIDYVPGYGYYDPKATWKRLQYKPLYTTRSEYQSILGSILKVPLTVPGKISQKGHFRFVGEINKGVHIYDIQNPQSPVYISFILIPGNIDIAIKNNVLYANSYSNLVAFDITDPKKVKALKILEKAFPQVFNYGFSMIDSLGGVLVGVQVDTLVECGNNFYLYDYIGLKAENIQMMPLGSAKDTSSATDTFSKSGSMSRFAINKQYLYAVDHHSLNLFDISNEQNPLDKGEIEVTGFSQQFDDFPMGSEPMRIWMPRFQGELETLFQTEKALFIGARDGMYIYGLNSELYPNFASKYLHVISCDPVIVKGDYAFVTLSAGSGCRLGLNQLEIINIEDLTKPSIVSTFPMENPQGLAVEGTTLIVAEGDFGFKVYDIKKTEGKFSLELLSSQTSHHAYDVLIDGTQASIIGRDGVYVYDIKDPKNLILINQTKSILPPKLITNQIILE